MINTNNNREQIVALMDKASNKVQIAVSWLTDETLIRKLNEIAKKKQVEILLSCDPLNVFRYVQIQNLKKSGAKVLKTGTNFPGQKGFMHAKYMIVDDSLVYGGSFNFTETANFNYENFNKYSEETLLDFKTNFSNWFSNGIDYNIGFENPEAIKSLVKEQFDLLETFRKGLISSYNDELNIEQATERENILKNEIEKDEKRALATELQNGSASISKNGMINKDGNGITSKPHRFYGGSILKTKFNGQKKPNSFSYANIHKIEIGNKFPFIKSRIENDTLICKGIFHPKGCNKYDIKIEYRAGESPRVYIINRKIESYSNTHVYSEGNLCLFYPGDIKWKNTTSIAEYTIPWIFEWILFYELYLHVGIWEGEFVEHKNINSI